MARATYIRDEQNNFEAVIILDEASGDSFEVQRILVVSDDDRLHGFDTYCLARGGAVHYGGVNALQVESERIILELDDPAAEALELPSVVEIQVESSDLESVRDDLVRMIAD
jgi:hypothetical protein